MRPKPCHSEQQTSLTETILWTISGVMILIDALVPQL